VENIAHKLGYKLLREKLVLATAESCTGGLISKLITDVPGSSAWFDRGFITYSNSAKHEMLGVGFNLIEKHGAVSEKTVLAMTAGAIQKSHADVAIAISGIAGPDGGTPEKPVGLVCFAWERVGVFAKSEKKVFRGNREEVRMDAAKYALQQMHISLGY